ncbi:MAG: hypothetical protein M3R70_14295 [Actinomycetota bacterium]|nr:hypothetical protein [Actinomycetota bacterium]
MKVPWSFARLVLEAAFLVSVATGLALADLRPLAIVLVMGAAWVVVALVERTASRHRDRDVQEPVEEPVASAVPEPPSHVTVLEPEPEPEPEPKEEPEEMPTQTEAETTAERPPDPDPLPDPEPLPEPFPEPEPHPGPDPRPPLLGQPILRPLPSPPLEPVPEPARAAVDERVIAFVPRTNGPRRWNIWDLERLARAGEGADALRDEERTMLLMHLREYAGADGILPESFDSLVRESFGELIGPAQR